MTTPATQAVTPEDEDRCDICCRPRDGHVGRDLQCDQTTYFRPMPSQAHSLPGDVGTAIEEAQFLCDRLDELDWSMGFDDFGNNYNGHVDPSHSRLKGYLAALTPAALSGDAAGPWQKVGTFEPEPDALYLVQGTLRTSVKRGADIDADNIFAARIAALPSHKGAGE